ncbi:MAG: hypothetical protein HZB51_17590 [Chloroflexi bacterium]|nr:hypothetical protein [Chloroflexota bacterium]
MAKAEIFPGNCGHVTTVEAKMDGKLCNLTIVSDCKAIQRLAEELRQVNPMNEISFRRSMPEILQKGAQFCTHAACPVPVGIIKAVEVEAKLALPMDAIIKLFKSE